MFVPIVEGIAVPHPTILAWFRTYDLEFDRIKTLFGLLRMQLPKRLTPLCTAVFTLPIFVVYLLLWVVLLAIVFITKSVEYHLSLCFGSFFKVFF